MRKGNIYVAMTGNRKPTSIYCAQCRRFHDTPRGLQPEICPYSGLSRPAGRSGVQPKSLAAAYIQAEKLGTKPTRTRTPVVLNLSDHPGPGEIKRP